MWRPISTTSTLLGGSGVEEEVAFNEEAFNVFGLELCRDGAAFVSVSEGIRVGSSNCSDDGRQCEKLLSGVVGPGEQTGELIVDWLANLASMLGELNEGLREPRCAWYADEGTMLLRGRGVNTFDPSGAILSFSRDDR